MSDESERRRELADTAENVAGLLIQHDKRITLLETKFSTGISIFKWVGGAGLTLLAALLASNWIPRP